METHEISVKHEFPCPHCGKSFGSYQARNSHQGKCPSNPGHDSLRVHYASIFQINERINEIRHGLERLYSEREKMFQQAAAEFAALKEQMSDVKCNL